MQGAELIQLYTIHVKIYLFILFYWSYIKCISLNCRNKRYKMSHSNCKIILNNSILCSYFYTNNYLYTYNIFKYEHQLSFDCFYHWLNMVVICKLWVRKLTYEIYLELEAKVATYPAPEYNVPTFLQIGKDSHFCLLSSAWKNTNSIEDVRILLPVRFRSVQRFQDISKKS